MSGFSVGPSIRRLGVAIRVRDACPRDAREVVGALVEGALRASEVSASQVTQQIEDDGTVLLLAVGVDEPDLVRSLVRYLRDATGRQGARGPGGGPVRLRLAIDQGLAMLFDGRYVGEVVETSRRLCAATVLPRLPPLPSPRLSPVTDDARPGTVTVDGADPGDVEAGDAADAGGDAGGVEVLVSPRVRSDLSAHERWRSWTRTRLWSLPEAGTADLAGAAPAGRRPAGPVSWSDPRRTGAWRDAADFRPVRVALPDGRIVDAWVWP